MLLDDPISKALWDGTMAWGDIPGICDYPKGESLTSPYKPSERRESIASEESEPDITTICSHSRRVAFAPQKQYAPKPVAVEVPPFTPGIKTVITRNLPRDVRVEQLRSVFEKYGPIKDIYIPKNMDRSSQYFGTIKGFALIKYLKSDDSARAYQSEYGRLTLGKNNITVEFAKEDRGEPAPTAAPSRPTPPPSRPTPHIPHQHKIIQEQLPYNHFRNDDGTIFHF